MTGFFLLPSYLVFGASPEAISQEYVVEVKCPSSDKQIKNYMKQGEITNKFKAQVHSQMLCTGKQKALFCVAEPDFETTRNVNIGHKI